MAKNVRSIIGKRFGNLTVLEATDKRKHRNILWKCKCDSGEFVEKTRTELYRIIDSANNISIRKKGRKFKDIAGQRYGRLVAKEFVRRENGMTYWKCKCDCGNDFIVNYANLTHGATKSCGCIRNTKYTEFISSTTDYEKKTNTIKAYVSK